MYDINYNDDDDDDDNDENGARVASEINSNILQLAKHRQYEHKFNTFVSETPLQLTNSVAVNRFIDETIREQ